MMAAERGSLAARAPEGREPSADAMLDAFVAWVNDRRLELYPAQEEAVLELLSGRHVVLATPTGSGKSLVATAQLFRGFCTGGRGIYTCPIKALVSEKFFELCEVFGPEQVGMMTGDASINRDAPILCCTAEILANMALCEGPVADVTDVVMDEFHFYADAERGVAWQVPLLTLPRARFLLMSATLGDMSTIMESLEQVTGRGVSFVTSEHRPVPLEYVYKETPLTQTIETLVTAGKAPIYVVSFTHRECVELGQALTSLNLVTKEQRRAVVEALSGARFDTPFGKDLRRCLGQGIGLHHAGLLPKYRRLVERLAQAGKLAVICGTDTLGVGINVPIRTVLFTKLCKYDGEQTRRLSVRELKQIAGRAGRRGYDHEGSVVCQAPEHVIENKVLAGKAEKDPGKRKKIAFKKPPERGYVHWDEGVFHSLVEGRPEALKSQFRVDHGMLLNLLERPPEVNPHGYRALVRLLATCHERDVSKHKLRARAKELFVALRKADVVHLERVGKGSRAVVSQDLQRDFSLHHSSSLYLVEALAALDPEAPGYALDVLSFVEAILESPAVLLEAQKHRARDELFQKLKAEGVEFEQRVAEVEQVSYPKPLADLIYDTYNAYAAHHPWLEQESIKPKSIMRDLYERYCSFNDYVKEYGIARAEGVLLRYLMDAYKTLVQTVPESYWNDDLIDIAAFLRACLERVDASLLAEWEGMLDPARSELPEGAEVALDPAVARAQALVHDPRLLRSQIRAELHLLVKTLSQHDYEQATELVQQPADDAWTKERFEQALSPFYGEHQRIVFDHSARRAEHTILEQSAPRLWRVRQVLLDEAEENTWYIEAEVDLRAAELAVDGPLLLLREIRS